MTNRERTSSTFSSVSWGRWAMSTAVPSHGCPPYDTSRPCAPGRALSPAREWPDVDPCRRGGRADVRPGSVLGVELDDQLLLDRRVDDLPGRERVHEDAQLSR